MPSKKIFFTENIIFEQAIVWAMLVKVSVNRLPDKKSCVIITVSEKICCNILLNNALNIILNIFIIIGEFIMLSRRKGLIKCGIIRS